jgi:N-acyl-phosphatidylethanolamine-hydrolysing phospholipase D
MRLLDRLRRRTAAAAGVVLAVGALSSCASTVNTYYDRTKPHHRPYGFNNNYLEFEPKSLATLMRWQLAAAWNGLPKPPQTPTPTVSADLAFIQANAKAGTAMQPAITWVGHATMLVQMGGLNLLTDPQFSERASPLSFAGPKRAQAPGVAPSDLPRIDVVLISHNHYDHLDEASVKTLHAQPGGPPLFIVPLGLKPWLAERGVTHVIEKDWWDAHSIGAVEIVLTPVQHWSARGLGDRLQTLWAGFALFAPELHVFFSGDTGYSKDFADVRARFAPRQRDGGFDIALIPVGAYEPRWFMQQMHVNPAESVQVHRDLGTKRSVGIHWGTFPLTDESLDAPPKALAAAKAQSGVSDDEFFLMAVGETRKLPRRMVATTAATTAAAVLALTP